MEIYVEREKERYVEREMKTDGEICKDIDEERWIERDGEICRERDGERDGERYEERWRDM